MSRLPAGILLIDKPVGPTSSAVVLGLRRLLVPRPGGRRRGRPQERIGHAGTLDPLASGLLLVLTGKGTRLGPFLLGLDKEYAAVVRLGTATDTLDRDGQVVASEPVPPAPDGLPAALAALTGEIAQAPPVFSALKRGGEALHRQARRGEAVPEPAPRRVRIETLEATAVRWGVAPEEAASPAGEDDPRTAERRDGEPAADLPPAPDGRVYEIGLRLRCSSGTYVRSLARDLAARLGTVGHLHALRRTRIGPFAVTDAAPLADPGDREGTLAAIRPLAAALPHLPAVTLDTVQHAGLQRCGSIDPAWLRAEVLRLADPAAVETGLRLLDGAGRLAAVCDRDPGTGELRPIVVFPTGAAGGDDPCA